MKMQIRLILLFIFGITYSSIYSQIAIDQWREHLPYSKCISVADADNLVYCATPYSLFYYNKIDNSVNRLTKVNGLSDVGVTQIRYHNDLNTLVVVYENTNIDLVKGNDIINISDIKRKSIIGKKIINSVYLKDNYAYLSCGFGIVVLDIENEEIKDTYYIGDNGTFVNVQDITCNDTAFFAVTEEGLYTASINSPNLADYSFWHKEAGIPHPNSNFNLIENFGNKIIINNHYEGYNTDTLYAYDGISWDIYDAESSQDVSSLERFGGMLLISKNTSLRIFDESDNLLGNIYAPNQNPLQPNDACIDSDENIWIADMADGLLKTIIIGWNAEYIELNGPVFPEVFALDVSGQDVWAVAGGRSQDWGPLYNNNNGYYSFVDESWNSNFCTPGNCNTNLLDTIRNLLSVAIHPTDKNRIYMGSFNGVVEVFNGEAINLYDEHNSSLQPWVAWDAKVIASGLDFDSHNNLWIANSGAENVLSVYTADGEWQSFNLGSSYSGIDLSGMVIDSYNQKWIIMRKAHSLLVFTDNNTPLDISDDEKKILGSSLNQGNIFASKVLCLAEDLDGELWLGTDEGIGVIYSPESVFTGGNYDVQRILVEWDGYVQYLLDTESISSIAIDGANRKWIGTTNGGVFLLSEDGTEQIHHFTAENSPLLSNNISSIKINNEGEVFIGTANGIISYKSDATPEPTDAADAYAYPNPVPSDYSGSIAIKNLMQDANVKITDISGNVVYEAHALGGQAIWDGNNFNGDRAQTGVYLVFATNEDGSETIVTKILFIN